MQMALDNDDARDEKEPEPPEFTELVRVAHAANLPEAELLKAELEACGIPAVLEGEGAGIAGVPDLGAGVPVLVPEKFAKQAAELIAEVEAARPEATDEEGDEDDDELLDEDEDEAEEPDGDAPQ
jgi:hypothetical protein